MMAAQKVDDRTRLRHNESMVSHTSWRVGGSADIYCEPRDVDELREVAKVIQPRRRPSLSDERRAEMAERMREVRRMTSGPQG